MLKLFFKTVALTLVFLTLMVSLTTKESDSFAENVAVSNVQAISSEKNVMVDIVVAKEDDRALKLANFFAAKKSPFVPVAADFVKIADKYSIDWTLLPSIAGLESSYGLHVPAYSYNPYGWNNGKYRFQSWSHATEVVAQALRTRYAPTGEITPYRIGKMYAESPTWAQRVAKNQAELTRFAAQ